MEDGISGMWRKRELIVVTMHGAFSLFFLCFHVLYLAHPFSKILMS
jgi:hypothetical protein